MELKPEDFQSLKNPTQQQEPILTSANIIDYLQENESNHSESLESEKTESEPEEITGNKEEMTTAYIAKIPEFTGENNDTSPQEWLNKVQKAEDANAELKDKLIKKVHSHAPADLTTTIKHAKSYEMAMEKANHTKLVNLAIRKTSSAAEEKIDQLTKKVKSYFTNQQQQQQQSQRYQPPQRCNQNNFGSPSNNQPQNSQIAQNANLSNIFPFEFEANESPFLLSNAAVNEQKAITAMYTEATVEGKLICLILDSGSAKSIITYQLIQQLKQNVDRPTQTVIVTTNALVGNDWLLKANANLNWKTQELKISYQGQYTIVSATCDTFNKRSEKALVFEFKEKKEMPLTETYMAFGSPSNWAEKTEQEIFKELRE
ncbi:hypothetical protein G9A89_009549 [Geosiphon pyriformis]|nr:hypothetical protein G9A89_009549 [Geosiphon pyriformis]